MAVEKEDNFAERMQAFKKDLNELLDKYNFQDIYRQIVENSCVQDAKEQLPRKHAANAYKKNSET